MADDWITPPENADAGDWVTPPGEKSYSWSDIPGAAMRNAPASASRFAGNIWQAVRHPIDTAEGIGDVALGAVDKTGLFPSTGHEQYADAVGNAFMQRYGGVENIKRSLAEDPVGMLADASSIATLGGAGIARLPGLAGDIGDIASTVGRWTDPLTVGPKAVGKGAQLTGLTKAGTPEQAALFGQKVLMTPGQMIGGYFKTLEDAATGWPILGDFIKSGRRNSIESFNKAVGNQALAPIGGKVTANAGHDLVEDVESQLSDAYDNIKPRLTFTPDAQWTSDIQNIANNKLSMLRPEHQQQFASILKNTLASRMDPATGSMSGDVFKRVESELTARAKKYLPSMDPDQHYMGDAINGVVDAMRSNLERSNPADAAELARINHGWAMYARIRDAAGRRTTSGGVFTPNDLLAAVKAGDKTVGKGSWAKGDALMQTFAEAGQKVLPSTIPTSGTSERLLNLAALPQLAGHLALGATAGMPYTYLGMQALRQGAKSSMPRAAIAGTQQAGRVPRITVNALPPELRAPSPFPQLPGPTRAEDQNQPEVPRPPSQQKHGGKVEGHNRFSHGGKVSQRQQRVRDILARVNAM